MKYWVYKESRILGPFDKEGVSGLPGLDSGTLVCEGDPSGGSWLPAGEIKDLGVICVESGFDLMVGGNGGIELRGTDMLCRVSTEAEVLEYCGAFMQLYREEARYFDRTAPWIARVGIAYARQRIVEDVEGRAALHQRFLYAQTFAQTDPWAERAKGADSNEFQPLPAMAS